MIESRQGKELRAGGRYFFYLREEYPSSHRRMIGTIEEILEITKDHPRGKVKQY